jgi:hypothetical protein
MDELVAAHPAREEWFYLGFGFTTAYIDEL